MDKKWWTLIVVCAGSFLLLLDVYAVSVAQPALQAGLHASFGDVQWTLDAYALTLAALLLTAGVLADRYGRKRLWSIGLVIFTLGSLLCGLASSPLMLIASRSAQGVGGAIVFSTSLALLANSFHGAERGLAFGVWGAVTGVATAAGPVLGGLITTDWTWRGIFLVNVPIGVVTLVVTIWRVDESRQAHPAQLDWSGFILLTAGLVSLVYGLTRAGETSWTESGTVACLAASVVLLAAFVAAEGRVGNPMFDRSLFRVPTFSGVSITAFTLNGSLIAMLLYFVIYLQEILGYSALDAGLRLAVISLAQTVTAAVAGRLSSHLPARWLIGPGLFLTGIGLVLMAGLTGASSWTHLIPGFIVAGLGAGLVNPPRASTAIGVVAPDKAGMASGVNSTFQQIGIAAGIATLGSIFTTAIRSHLSTALPGSLSGKEAQIADAVHQGTVAHLLATVPPGQRAAITKAVRSSFASGIDELVYVAAGVALVGALCAALLIRSKDLHRQQPAPEQHDADDTAEVVG